MQDNEKELIFQSSDEALQMLANVTGKKISIPVKNDKYNANNITEEISQQKINHEKDEIIDQDSTTAEGPVQQIEEKINKLTDIKEKVQSAMNEVKEVV